MMEPSGPSESILNDHAGSTCVKGKAQAGVIVGAINACATVLADVVVAIVGL